MPFCYKCGKELTPGKPFCKYCGAHIATPALTGICTNCGSPAKQSEKFCSVCGHPIAETPSQPFVSLSQPNNPNKGHTSSSLPGQISSDNHQQIPDIQQPATKKKKRSCLGCFFKTLIAVFLLAVAGILAIYFATDWLDDAKKNSNSQTTENQADRNNNGIENEITLSKADAKNLDEAIERVEDAFSTADTNQLKQFLTVESAKKYQGVFHEIQPYMKEYARVFKNRKREKSNSFFALYSFSDETGKKYTAEFALTGEGTWKLVRF